MMKKPLIINFFSQVVHFINRIYLLNRPCVDSNRDYKNMADPLSYLLLNKENINNNDENDTNR